MRRLLSPALAGVLVLAVAGTTLAAKGGNGASSNGAGAHTATISLVQPPTLAAIGPAWPSVGNYVSFSVTANVKTNDVSSLWVANWCYQNGVAIYAQFLPVQSWVAGPFALSWSGGAASCNAYVFLFPYTHTPLSGGSLTYTVSG